MKRTPLDSACRNEVAQMTAQLLADTYLLYTKTQNFHWNVVDPRFFQLHKFFEEQYEELAEALDIIAERIRMLGARTPGAMQQYLELSNLEESTEELSADQMLRQLSDDHTFIADTLRSSIEETSRLGDEGTADMMINRLRAHEKTIWMLQSHLRTAAALHR